MFQDRVLRRIHGPMKDEITVGSTKLHNKELHQNNQVNEDKTDKESSMHCRGLNMEFWLRKYEGWIPLETPRCIGEDNIKRILQNQMGGVVNWIHVAYGRDWWHAFVNTVMNIWIP
jgi:hypothetical protein